MFDGRFRHAVNRGTSPVGAALVRLGVSADALTVSGLVLAAVAAVVIGSGHFAWGIVAMTASGLPDLFDGPVAKAAGTVSVRGAFLDSVADRVADALLYGGLAWYIATRHGGTTTLVPFAILAVTSLISYERAKAETLGLSAKGGLMERAERFVVLGACLLAAAVDPGTLVPSLVVFLVLVAATAVGRFVRVVRSAPVAGAATGTPRGTRSPAGAGAERPPATTRPGVFVAVAGELPVWRRGRVDSRWRAWRAARAAGGARLVGGPVPEEAAGVASRSGAAAGSSVGGWLASRPRRGSGELSARWRARRAGMPGSRVGQVWRERRTGRSKVRSARRSAAAGR